jgi:hypothetical protein
MRLKDLLSERVVVDKKIQSEIDELGMLTDKIDKLKKQLQPLQKRYGQVVEGIIPIIDKLDKETLITNNFIMKIIRKGYDRENYSYKEGFLNGLNKVNENTKKILQQILEETKKLTKINPSFSVKPIGEAREGRVDFSEFLGFFKYLLEYLFSVLIHLI